MTKSKGGSGHRKGKNSDGGDNQLILKEDGQEYAIVTKALGDRRFSCILLGNKRVEILARLRGKLKNQKWKHMVLVGGYVLVSYRDFQDDKCEIIHTYSDKDVKDLVNLGEIERETDETMDGVVIGDDDDQINSELVENTKARVAFSKDFDVL